VSIEQESAFKAWNLGEKGMLKHMLPLFFPSIKYNKKIYLDRNFLSITSEFILKEYTNHTINTITPTPVERNGI
jgi:hormone-sensitive lipase